MIVSWLAALCGQWQKKRVENNIRKVSSGFLVLDLLLGKEPGEGNNVGVDLLTLLASTVCKLSRHG